MTARQVIQALHDKCGETILRSFEGEREQKIARALEFVGELETWADLLAGRPEQKLVLTASRDYPFALLNICQGQHRNAFKGLRLVLELSLQATYLSTNLIDLLEWLDGRKDTYWAHITDVDNGVFSTRFSTALFKELGGHSKNFMTIAKTVYRELSECIHGNIPNQIPLPISIEFDDAAFQLWCEKCATVRLLIHFALTLRFLKELSPDAKARVEAALLDQLGHIEAVRLEFGGPAG